MQPPYAYSPITERPDFSWPGGKRLAFYIGLNIEHYLIDRPSTSIFGGTAMLQPDPLNYGWRDYGPRVGIWRMIEALDRLGLRASAIINTDVFKFYPQIVEAGLKRDWCWVAHGTDNSTLQTGLDIDAERAGLTAIVETLKRETGRLPQGWLGPALSETANTPALLKELGLRYILDWCHDDQPCPLTLPGMISVPYSIEVNDIPLFIGRNLSGPEFVRIIRDQFDQLLADSASAPRVMALALHPFIINQPFRHRYLVEALEYIAGRQEVWLTTSDDIAAHYFATLCTP